MVLGPWSKLAADFQRAVLAEARAHAERALALKGQLDLSAEPWLTLSILAQIAELEGDPAAALAHRRREREAFAAFAGNRWHIDRQHAALIRDIAAAARGDEAQRAAVEERMPQLEAKGWRIAGATYRLWAGERDWHALCEGEEGVDSNSALIILRALEEAG